MRPAQSRVGRFASARLNYLGHRGTPLGRPTFHRTCPRYCITFDGTPGRRRPLELSILCELFGLETPGYQRANGSDVGRSTNNRRRTTDDRWGGAAIGRRKKHNKKRPVLKNLVKTLATTCRQRPLLLSSYYTVSSDSSVLFTCRPRGCVSEISVTRTIVNMNCTSTLQKPSLDPKSLPEALEWTWHICL